jgi:hypothetical protein
MREYEACIAAGESTWRWEQKWDPVKRTGFPMWYKANILAWHSMHKLKEVHSSDVVATIQERESKKRRNR